MNTNAKREPSIAYRVHGPSMEAAEISPSHILQHSFFHRIKKFLKQRVGHVSALLTDSSTIKYRTSIFLLGTVGSPAPSNYRVALDPSLVPEILKIEDVNHRNSNPNEPFRQLFGYAISAKRYALYSRVGDSIRIEKASGHGLGYLFAPKELSKGEEDEETPQWVFEAWEFLLRKALKLPPSDPSWLDLPAMMRMVVTTPNVFKQRRPEWLGPFNFFLFPMLSETFGGYPAGFDKSNFVFIVPYESDRKKWGSLGGVNLTDGDSYQISMRPTPYQDSVVPESFRILLRKYLGKPEVKSLAPDGTTCIATTRGLLQRATILAGKLVPVGKETDRRWEQGEDPSMIDSDIFVYEKRTKLVIADPSERKKFAIIGLRRLARESKLSLAPVGKVIKGEGVRPQTLSIIRQTAAKILTE